MSNYIENLKSRLPSTVGLEIRITEINKTKKHWKLSVDIYSNWTVGDEYECSGYIYIDDIEEFHPVDSLHLFSEK